MFQSKGLPDVSFTPPSIRSRRFSRRSALRQTGVAMATAGVVSAGLRGRAHAQATPGATPTTGSSAGDVTPERAAMAVDRVRDYAREILERTGLPGMAVAVVYGDDVLLAEGFGVREVGKPEPIDADTVFQLASVSKSLAASTVAAVVGDGTVRWDSRIADIAPGFALAEAWPTAAVTVADLFSHRSGLPDHAGDILEDLGYPQAETLHRLRFLQPEYSFRAGYAYTTYGLTAGAEAVATAAGVPWVDLAHQRLYEPLGMSSTSSRFADYMAASNRAVPHVQRDGKWVVTPQQRDPDSQTPAGGVSSTVNDMARWLRMILGDGTFEGQEVVAASALRPAHLPQSVSREAADPATQRDSFYGFGTNVSYTNFGQPQWSHSGAFALGAGTAYYVLPASNFGIVALGNGAAIGAPEALCLDVLDIAQTGAVTRDWLSLILPDFAAIMAPQYGTELPDAPPANPQPALDAAAYTGTYENDFYGPVEIVADGDTLALLIGPAARTFPLTHFDRDLFTWQPEGENAQLPSALAFTIGPAGTAVSFDDDYLTWGGAGHLVRPEADTE